MSACHFFPTTAEQAALGQTVHYLQPQANTCTDLMTVFYSGHVAAVEICMYVCVSLEESARGG